jgi:large subunit ribosomal protein L17
MRHLKKGRKFGMKSGKRKSFLSILIHNLIINGRIRTSEARAKEIRPMIEKLVTIAKRGDLASLRLLIKRIPKDAAYKLYHEIAPRYKNRSGGYVRIIKTASMRKRDGSSLVIIEFI